MIKMKFLVISMRCRAFYQNYVEAMPVQVSGVLDVDIEAVPVSGQLTFDGDQPPSSVYQDGRLFLRNTELDDSLLLGSTHGGSLRRVEGAECGRT